MLSDEEAALSLLTYWKLLLVILELCKLFDWALTNKMVGATEAPTITCS